MRPKLELLEPELIDRVLSEAYELLLNPGVKVQSPEARELAGAGRSDDRWRRSRTFPKHWRVSS